MNQRGRGGNRRRTTRRMRRTSKTRRMRTRLRMAPGISMFFQTTMFTAYGYPVEFGAYLMPVRCAQEHPSLQPQVFAAVPVHPLRRPDGSSQARIARLHKHSRHARLQKPPAPIDDLGARFGTKPLSARRLKRW